MINDAVVDRETLFSEEDLLPLSALSDVVFCERRAGLHLVERIWEDNLFTAEGSVLHERVHGLTGTETRGGVRIARGLMLRSFALGVSGKADVVEFHPVDTSPNQACTGVLLAESRSKWRPFPVEYKRGKLRHNMSFEVQLCAQAICLEEMLAVHVPQGALFFGKTARRLEIDFDDRLRTETKQAALRLHEIVRSGTTPVPKHEAKCAKCTLVSVCLPRITSRKTGVRAYLRRAREGLKVEIP